MDQGLLTLWTWFLPESIFSSDKAEFANGSPATVASDNTAGGKIGPALRVASETAPLGVARRLFGMTKLLSSRLDCRCFRGNKYHVHSVNRP